MSSTAVVAGVVLAAGSSSRMGRPKALLPVGDTTFVQRIVGVAASAGLAPVRVVVGGHGPLIEEACPELAPLLVVNPDPSRGQLSSLQAALGALDAEPLSGVAVFLVDHPLVRRQTVVELIGAFGATRSGIVVPAFGGRRGHPVVFGRRMFPALLAAPLERGARAVLESHPEEILELPVEDGGVLADIDTPAELHRHIGRDG